MISNGPVKTHAALHSIPKLILVCLFALCTLIAASYGLNSYRNVYYQTENNFVGRTGLVYVATKIRHTNIAEIKLSDPDKLVLIEEIENERFAMSIYVKDGMLVESFGSDRPDAPTFDTEIAAVNEFKAVLIADDLIKIELSDSTGNKHSTVVYVPRTEKEVKS